MLLRIERQYPSRKTIRCDKMTHCQEAAASTGDSKTSVARKQLCGNLPSPTKERALMKETFSVRFVPRLHNGKFLKNAIGPKFPHGFQTSVCTRLYNKTVQATSTNHQNL
jgi:hypothetical protein